jgi:D-ribose pyranase
LKKAWIAEEWLTGEDAVLGEMRKLLGNTPTDSLPHDKFKEMLGLNAVAVIRTRERTPYANVILQSGVVF